MKASDKHKKKLKDQEREAAKLKERLKHLAANRHKRRVYDKNTKYQVPFKHGDYFMIERY